MFRKLFSKGEGVGVTRSGGWKEKHRQLRIDSLNTIHLFTTIQLLIIYVIIIIYSLYNYLCNH